MQGLNVYAIKSLEIRHNLRPRAELHSLSIKDTSKMSRIAAEIIIVSDIHIRYPNESRYDALIRLISQIDAGVCKKFLLLGDIFDFCFGKSPFCQKLFRSLGDALEQLAQKGVEVIYLEGNHEFSMFAIGWQGVKFLKVRSYQFPIGEQTIAITHGDLLEAPWHYHLFRGFLKSWIVAFCCRWLVPQEWFYKLCLSFAQYSRDQDDTRDLNHHRILKAAEGWLAEEKAQIGFFGHFHVPYFHQVQKTNQTLMSCLSWDSPNAMTYHHQKGFHRYAFDHDAKIFRPEPARPFSF